MKKELNIGLQSLKGIAAISVFLYHALMQYPSELISGMYHSGARLFFDGESAVLIFMALSGFFYYKDNSLSINDLGGGILKKLFRIYVPFIIVMVLAYMALNFFYSTNVSRYTPWAAKFWTEKASPIQLIKQLTIVKMGNPSLINPPIWYLKCEVEMFLLMPIIVMVFRKIRWYALIPVLLFCLIPAKQYVFTYLLGMLSKFYIDRKKEKLELIIRNKYIRIGSIILSLVLIDIVNLIWLPFEQTDPTILGHQFENHNIIGFLLVRVVQGLGVVLLIGIIYLYPLKFLSTPALSFMGKVSYEFYLIHFVVILVLRRYLATTIGLTVSVFCISIVLALFINHVSSEITSSKIARNEICRTIILLCFVLFLFVFI